MKNITSTMLLFSLLVTLLVSASAQADVSVPPVIGNHMVIQRDAKLPIWGKASPGEKVVVTLEATDGSAMRSDNTNANDKGEWMVKLDAVRTGPTYKLTIKGANTLTFSNILAGEVWVCSGQSNMEWSMNQVDGGKEAAAKAKLPQIRLFKTNRAYAPFPKDHCDGAWQVCSPQNTPGFSAVAFFFGRKLHNELHVPVGLIQAAWGGTRVEPWTPRRQYARSTNRATKAIHQAIRAEDKRYNETVLRSIGTLRKWIDEAEDAAQKGEPIPPTPGGIPQHKYATSGQQQPSVLYNAMIAPHVPFAIRGAIWYQGESNVGQAYDYREIFADMITGWRHVWDQGDFPFYFVQLAPFRYRNRDPNFCAELWDSQLYVLKNVKNTGMAVTTDIGNIRDIHPRNKKDVGERLALWALHHDYGEKNVFSGPIYESMTVEGSTIRVQFKYAGGLKSRDGNTLSHFKIAGEDKTFHPADAKIDGDTVIVSCKDVAKPVAVRFGFNDTAEPNLMNGAGLPASPFRTDNWKLMTQK